MGNSRMRHNLPYYYRSSRVIETRSREGKARVSYNDRTDLIAPIVASGGRYPHFSEFGILHLIFFRNYSIPIRDRYPKITGQLVLKSQHDIAI